MKTLIIVLLLSTCFSVYSQTKILFTENFKNNKNEWQIKNDSSFKVEISNGVLHLEKRNKNFDDRGCLWYKKEIKNLNTLKDFSITFFAKFISGGDHSDMIDLQWGFWDKKISSKITNIYQLNFFFKGDVKLDHFINKGWDYSLRGKNKEISKEKNFKMGDFNKYEIIQEDGFVIFKINDKQYFKQYTTPIAGNTIGIQGCLKSVWEIDKITVKQIKRKNITTLDSLNKTTPSDSLTNSNKSFVKVFPNPFTNDFTVVFNTQKNSFVNIELYDILGNLILQYEKKVEIGEQKIRLFADVIAGTYFVKLKIENVTSTIKLIKF